MNASGANYNRTHWSKKENEVVADHMAAYMSSFASSSPTSASSAPSFVAPSPPQHNGGLYTGEPFLKNAPWANVPVVPDAGAMNFVTLSSAGPAPYGRYHLPGGGIRPGNNTPMIVDAWAKQRVPDLGLLCIPDDDAVGQDGDPQLTKAPPGAQPEQGAFRRFAYLPARGCHPLHC